MKKLALAFVLLSSSAMGQTIPQATDYYKQTIGNCVAESALLYEQANKFASEVQQLKAKIAELEKKSGDKPDEAAPSAPSRRPNFRPGEKPQ